jgi:hypothetical protein
VFPRVEDRNGAVKTLDFGRNLGRPEFPGNRELNREFAKIGGVAIMAIPFEFEAAVQVGAFGSAHRPP